jgi:hypothetical protein
VGGNHAAAHRAPLSGGRRVIGRPARSSSRLLMYLIVGLEMLVLTAIVASQELNRALDRGPGVDLDIVNASARKDPFRGGYLSGLGALDVDGSKVALPEPLEPGDKVLVFFAVEPGRRPRITSVQRGARGAPQFSPTAFSIPATVLGNDQSRPFTVRGTGQVARIGGNPAITVQLDLPSTIPVDHAAVEPLSAPSMVRARLHRGFFEHRYLDDVRLIGRGWTPSASFAYDDTRGRLMVLTPRDIGYGRSMPVDEKPQSDVFFFDGLGQEQGSVAVAGRLVEGVVDPASGHLLALVSEQRRSHTEVSLIRLRQDGGVTERSPIIAHDRILGLDAATGDLWVLVGLASASRTGPYFVERMTFAGPQGPRLGPFVSQPRRVVVQEGHVWVVEPTHHRITRFELATGRTLMEYRELNGPTEIAVDAGALYVIEANRTQLTKFASDGHLVWRLPRFQGLAWVLGEAGTGNGLLGATRFDGKDGGLLRVGPNGTITRIAAGMAIQARAEWRRNVAPDAVRATRSGRLYLLGNYGLEIVGPDGVPLKRI